jgi:hypothetical protein
MNQNLPVIAALAALGYYLFTKDKDQDADNATAPALPPTPYAPPPQYATAPAPPYAPPVYAPPPAPRPTALAIPPSDELLRLASALYNIAGAPGAPCAAIASATASFQAQAAADGHRISVDGKYGPGTSALLGTVLARQGLHAPPDLWGAGRRCHTSPGAKPGAPGAAPSGGGAGSHADQLLHSQMGGPIFAGDTYLANADYNAAVEAYKAAGHAAVTSVAPAVDAQTRGGSAVATREAWLRNADLAKVPSRQFNGQASTVANAYQARDIAHRMFDLYATALGVAPNLMAGYMTGIGTVIPSQYKKPSAGCLDAGSDLQLCAAIGSALASETQPTKLRAFAAAVAATGYPAAANALLAKADTLG